jgi:D-alanine-D-alanine ligase
VNLDLLKTKSIAVLMGGTSAERDVSLQSGATIRDALLSLGYSVCAIDPADSQWMQQLRTVDYAFNALHGPGGEDGAMQGVLTALNIPFTGSEILGSALAMDKVRSKQLWQGIGLSTGGFTTLAHDSDWQSVIDRFGKVFVKPACEGSSIGMTFAEDAKALELAFIEASKFGREVLAEQFFSGPEYTVAILGGVALPSIRMETDNAFYDYDAKYISNETRYHCPSDLTADEERQVSTLALAAFESLGCSVWGRVDLMRDADGIFYVLEVNTIPGMTTHSLVPMAAAATGMDVPALVEKIVALSLEART